MKTLAIVVDRLGRLLGRFGPYLLIELVLPGGTLIALSLYLRQAMRQRQALRAAAAAR
jgi:hypothetical protein